MRKRAVMLLALLAVGTSVWVAAAEFKVYPGAKLDQKATDEARKLAEMVKQKTPALAANTGQPSIYTTSDSFDQVVVFYRTVAKEYQMPGPRGRKLPSGQPLSQAFFIFDGAPDLAGSKLWAKIQRPYVADLAFEDIRDITAIVMSERK